jgi:hypothetical protein
MDDRTGAEKNPEKTARKVAKDLAPADPAAIMDPRMWRSTSPQRVRFRAARCDRQRNQIARKTMGLGSL